MAASDTGRKQHITVAEKQLMATKLSVLMNKVYDLTDENGVNFIDVFLTLPLRANTEYYKVIKTPMSYSKIKSTLKHSKYSNPQQFVDNLIQISWNARFYNEINSEFYKYATILDDFIKETIIPTIRDDIEIFGHDEVKYISLGELPSDEPKYGDNEEPENQDDEDEDEEEDEEEEEEEDGGEDGGEEDEGEAEQPKAVSNAPTPAVAKPVSTSSKTEDYGDEANDTRIPKDEDEDEDEDYEEDQSIMKSANTTSTQGYSTMLSYNTNNYVSKTENSNQSNIYNPPRVDNMDGVNGRLLDQWVKRGRPPIVDKPHEQRIKSIMRGLKKIKVDGKTIITVFDKLPNQIEHPGYYRMIKEPISMLDIKGLIKQRHYKAVEPYMTDVFKLIANSKAYYVNNPKMLDSINLLESNITRLYHLEMEKPDSEYISDISSPKTPVPFLMHNGKEYKVGHWVLVKNPNDPSKPIVGQIFRMWRENSEDFVNVCWYYRPEWTTHRYDRLFLENEVFKTGQYRDHPLTDIVGSCYVAYFTRWLKGDPAVKYEGPLFVCEFRYNDREQQFAKIRTWKACLPDEIRHIEDPVTLIDNPRVLKKFPSPIKYMLRREAKDSDPIPTPVIYHLNAPPLIGGIYFRKRTADDDINYFDETLTSTQFKTYIPPSANLKFNSTVPPTTQNHPLGLPSPLGHQSTPDYRLQSLNSSAPQYQVYGQMAGTGPQFLPRAADRQLLQQQQQRHQSPIQQNPQFLQGNNYTSANAFTGGHRTIQSTYNTLAYTFSQYNQPTYSQTFVVPSVTEQELPKYVRKQFALLDLPNFQRFSKNVVRHNFLAPTDDSMMKVEDLLQSIKDASNAKNKGKTGNSTSPELAPLIWFKGVPQYIPSRLISSGFEEDDDDPALLMNPILKKRKLNGGLQRVKLGHSSKYLAWKLSQQQQLTKE